MTKTQVPKSINYKNNNLANDKVITDAFCDFFSTIGSTYANKIPKTSKKPNDYMKVHSKNSIYLEPTDPEEIDKIVSNLKPKSSSGHDNFTSKLLKSLKTELKTPLSILANISINEGTYPETYKLAEVVPIYKSKSKDDVGNYRPISLLPTFSKILEKLLHKRIYKFLQKNNILYNSQYGFRAKHSTNDAITEFITDVTNNLEKKSNTLSIFLDLSKAFDTIDHNILLTKLNRYGIRGTPLKWFESYLTSRKQYVKINKSKSTINDIACGVPQDSVLGPLLFILYTNDLPNSLEHTHAILFADDTTIYLNSNNINSLYENVNKDLNSLYEWFNTNKLSLNISKTNYMLISNIKQAVVVHEKYRVKIGDENIEYKKSLKFLGLIIDENLNWHDHIHYTKNKISKITYSIKMIKHTLPLQNIKTLYETLVQPHMEYGITLWGGTHDTYVNQVIVQQKKL